MRKRPLAQYLERRASTAEEAHKHLSQAGWSLTNSFFYAERRHLPRWHVDLEYGYPQLHAESGSSAQGPSAYTTSECSL